MQRQPRANLLFEEVNAFTRIRTSRDVIGTGACLSTCAPRRTLRAPRPTRSSPIARTRAFGNRRERRLAVAQENRFETNIRIR